MSSNPISGSGKNRGNALFLILIAVALFAALSYAVTQSGRGATTTAREDAELGLAKLNNFTAQIQAVTQRMKIGNNLPIYGLFFNNDVYQRISNAVLDPMGSPADPSLYVFHAAGGGVTPSTFTELTTPCSGCNSTNLKPGHVRFYWINVPSVGTTAADLALSVASVTAAVCQAANTKSNLSAITAVGDLQNYFDILANGTPPSSVTAMPAALTGKTMFCLKDNTTGRYWYMNLVEIN